MISIVQQLMILILNELVSTSCIIPIPVTVSPRSPPPSPEGTTERYKVARPAHGETCSNKYNGPDQRGRELEPSERELSRGQRQPDDVDNDTNHDTNTNAEADTAHGNGGPDGHPPPLPSSKGKKARQFLRVTPFHPPR